MTKREFCPECHVFLDEDRRCEICDHMLIDIEMDEEDIEKLVKSGVFIQLETGEYNLTEFGIDIVLGYVERKKDEKSS